MKKLALALTIVSVVALCLWQAQAQVPVVWPAPQGAQVNPLSASASGTTGAISATLPGATGKLTYVCGFVVTSSGTTPVVTGNVTITGTSPILNFIYNFVNSGQGLLGVALPGCIVSSAAN